MSNPTPRPGLMARAIREALESVMSPDASDGLLKAALRSAGLDVIPEEGEQVYDFVENHLRVKVEEGVSLNAAGVIVDELGRITHMAQMQVRAKKAASEPPAEDRPTPVNPISSYPNIEVNPKNLTPVVGDFKSSLPAPSISYRPAPSAPSPPLPRPISRPTMQAPGRGMPIVLIASHDEAIADRMDAALDGNASVQRMDGLEALMDALAAALSLQPILVLDCRSPSVQALTVANIASELPQGTAVLLWGASKAIEAEVAKVNPLVSEWIRCGAEATPEDVALLLMSLIG